METLSKSSSKKRMHDCCVARHKVQKFPVIRRPREEGTIFCRLDGPKFKEIQNENAANLSSASGEEEKIETVFQWKKSCSDNLSSIRDSECSRVDGPSPSEESKKGEADTEESSASTTSCQLASYCSTTEDLSKHDYTIIEVAQMKTSSSIEKSRSDCLKWPFGYVSTTCTIVVASVAFAMSILAYRSVSFLTLPVRQYQISGLLPKDDLLEPIHQLGLFFLIICEENLTEDEMLSYGPSYQVFAPTIDDLEKGRAGGTLKVNSNCQRERIDHLEIEDTLWTVSRIASTLSLILGGTTVLWLLVSTTTARLNLWAVGLSSVVSYFAQAMTFLVFGSDLCKSEWLEQCQMSNGSFCAIVACFGWFATSGLIMNMWYVRYRGSNVYVAVEDDNARNISVEQRTDVEADLLNKGKRKSLSIVSHNKQEEPDDIKLVAETKGHVAAKQPFRAASCRSSFFSSSHLPCDILQSTTWESLSSSSSEEDSIFESGDFFHGE